MVSKWDMLKNAVFRSEEYFKRLAGIDNYYEGENEQVKILKNSLTAIIDSAKQCLESSGDMTTLDKNNEHLKKLDEMKNSNRRFKMSAITTKVMNECVANCAKINDLLKQQESGQISSTIALTEVYKLMTMHSKLIEEYRTTLYALEFDSNSMLEEIINYTHQTIEEGFNKFKELPDLDLNEVEKNFNLQESIPTDSLIQNRIDENQRVENSIETAINRGASNKSQSVVESSLDNSLSSLAQLCMAMEDMLGGSTINLRSDELMGLMHNSYRDIQVLYESEKVANQETIDYSFLSDQYGSVMDSVIKESNQELLNYNVEISESLIETLKELMMESNDAQRTGVFLKETTTLMKSMLNEFNGFVPIVEEIKTKIGEVEKIVDANITQVSVEENDIVIEQKNKDIPIEETKNGHSEKEEIVSASSGSNEISEQAFKFESTDDLTAEDAEILNIAIENLGKYEWIKHSLLNDRTINISAQFRKALEGDMVKDQIESVCSKTTRVSEGDMPFVQSEVEEIHNIIKELYQNGKSPDEIVKSAAFEIKHNSSSQLQTTWKELSENFNEKNHLYFYLSRQYLEDVSRSVFQELQEEMER